MLTSDSALVSHEEAVAILEGEIDKMIDIGVSELPRGQLAILAMRFQLALANRRFRNTDEEAGNGQSETQEACAKESA